MEVKRRKDTGKGYEMKRKKEGRGGEEGGEGEESDKTKGQLAPRMRIRDTTNAPCKRACSTACTDSR